MDDLSYVQERKSINEQKENNLNPDVEEGDVVELIHMDDPWGISPMTRGVVMGFEDMGPMGEKILVKWIVYNPDENGETFRNLPLIKDVDYWRLVNPLSEEVNEENQTDLDLERFGNILVRAYFTYGGGWGQPPKRFVVYMTPSGIVKGVSLNQGMTNREVPFKEGEKVNLGDLIRFEKNSKFDLQMKGRIRESVIKEQINRYDLTKMTPALWKILKMVDKLLNGKWNLREFKNVLYRYFDMTNHIGELYLILTYNNPDIHELITTADWEDIKIPNFYETELEHYGPESEETQQDECIDGVAQHTANECECSEYEQGYLTRVDKEGEEWEELVNCEELDDEEELQEAFGISSNHDCPCEEYYEEEYTVYWNPIVEKTILSTRPILEIMGQDSWDEVSIADLGYDDSYDYLLTHDDITDDNFDEATQWDYFDDRSYGLIDSDDDYQTDAGEQMQKINQTLYGPSKTITEQEQLNLFPTGQFHFPEGLLDDEEKEYVKDELPDNLVKTIFNHWDKKGIDFSILKMLGIDTRGASLLITMLLKRYIQFTTKPLTGTVTWDCDDLANLFNTDNRDYDMEYIEEYLCGKDSFWDWDSWYNYEFEDWMVDEIDNDNIMTIGEILGVDNWGSVENILKNNPQNEEQEKILEEKEEEVGEIRMYLTSAYNDEHEYGVKNAMANDIIDKITDYFEEGNLVTTDDGTKQWHIEFDLKDLLVDKWDNTEYFDYTDYDGNTLEGIMMDDGLDYLNTQRLADIILKSYYNMYDGVSKVGDELEAETKFYDGYWSPDIDINEHLKDRLGELRFFPEPIQEQSADSPGDNISDEREDGDLDNTPFTKLDINIMNRLAKMFPRDEIRTIWEESEENLSTDTHTKFVDFIKLFGEDTYQREDWAKATRFAKWTDDNWNEAERAKQLELGVTPDTTISDLDFGLVTQPVKEWPSLYNIDGNESYWVKEYRYGDGDFAGYGEEDALNKAEQSWFEYDIDMEYGDQGDTDDHDLNVDNAKWLKSLKEARITGLLYETGMLKEMEFDKNQILKLAKNTKGGLTGGRGEVFKYLSNLRDSGIVNMFQAPDFLWSGKQWLTKWLDLNYPERLEDPDENIQYLLDNADKVRDILIILLMDRADREDRKANLDNLNREIRPLAVDLVKIWSIQLG